MKYSTDQVQHSLRKANRQAGIDRFNNQLKGFGGMIGVPHWQFVSKFDNYGSNHYLEQGYHADRPYGIGPVAAAAKPLKDRFAGIKRAYLGWRERRKNIKELNQLSDRTLRDIGLTRVDIHAVATGRITAEKLNEQRYQTRVDNPRVSENARLAAPVQVDSIPACNQENYSNAA